MPVGTQGTVKTLTMDEVASTGARIVLGNTYHLWLRPGPEAVAAHKKLHGFTRWPFAMLTDSGGFQAFSLAAALGAKAGKGEADGQTPDTLFPTFKAPFWPLQANVLGSNELNRRSPSLPPSPLSLLPLSSPSSAEGQRGREGRRGRERGRNQREKRGEKERERGQRARAGSVDATNLPSFTKLPSFAVLYGEVARPRKLAWREAAKVRSDAECHNPKP
jgi:hypothetical protein